MIRRWSSINTLNFELTSFKKFNKIFHLCVFKSSVYYKRFFIKRTKFKRKSIARWKHRTNWSLYLNILKYWSSDYRFTRQMGRYQFFNNIFINSFFIYNFNYIKVSYAKVFSSFSPILTTGTSKKLFRYYNFKNWKLGTPAFKNSNLVLGFLPNDSRLDDLVDIVPVYSKYSGYLYFPDTQVVSDLESIYRLIFQISIVYTLEIYKNLVIFLFFKLNVNYLCF